MNRFYWVIFFVALFTALRAQEPRFLQHDIGDANVGIPINRMLQDHQCMLWLGTDSGLARYDGNVWRQITLDSSLLSIEVTSLMEDQGGKIWIGTLTGRIFCLDATRKMQEFEVEEGHPSKPVTSIVEDHQGQIWFATYGEGVYVYTGSRMYNFGIDDGLSGNDIYSMTSTAAGVWLGTDDGINICNFQNERKQIRSLGLNDGLPDQIITTLKADRYGNVWIGTFENGIVYFDATLNKVLRPFENEELGEVTAFGIFDETELWVGTRTAGLWRYNPDSKFIRRLVNYQSLHSGEITDIISDVEGNIWVSLNEGVLISAFRPFESLLSDVGEIQTLFCDHKDQLWIGTKNGLYRIEENTNLLSKTIRVAPGYDFNITNIQEDKFNNLWIGTLDRGLFIYNPSTSIIKQIQSKELAGNTILSMGVTKKEIWLATLEGVNSYPREKNILNERNPSFNLIRNPWQSNLHFVYQVFVDSRDRIWFATDGNGVFCIDGDNVTQHQGKDSLLLRKVYSICQDHNGHLWFNTPDIGLVEFDGQHYKPLDISEGLGNMNIASIANTGNGDIIIAHHRGIDLMEPERRHFMYYTDEVGVKEIDPGLNSIARDSDGHIYLSGRNIIIKYYSTKNKLSIHPRTQLTQVSVFEQPVDFTIQHKFSHDENYISFDYVGLWYSSPKSVKYLYKLEGYDRQWKESKDNVASYSSLPPGSYTFSVKASENKFFLDEPITSYSFDIARPFWKKYWFIVSMILLSAGIFYWVIRSRDKKLQRQAVLKKDMIESQLQALKAQINPHFLFNSFNTLITIIDENTQQPTIAIEYVEKLSDFFRSILQYREHESITLEEEWELVQTFGYLLKKRYGSNLRLHMPTPAGDAYILPLTLQMLVENAVKHNVITENRPLDVYITIDEDGYVTVKNNLQPKAKLEPSTQFGLQSIIKRYNLLSNKKVVIEKDNLSFKVRIPILKKPEE